MARVRLLAAWIYSVTLIRNLCSRFTRRRNLDVIEAAAGPRFPRGGHTATRMPSEGGWLIYLVLAFGLIDAGPPYGACGPLWAVVGA